MSKATYKDEPPRSSTASAYSLQPYADEVESDLPPAYTEAGTPAIASSQQPVSSSAFLPEIEAYGIPGGKKRTGGMSGSQASATVSLHPDLSSDPKMLCDLIKEKAKLPPRPYVLIKGTHSQTTNDGKGGKKKETVVDFEFNLDVAGTLLRGWKGDGLPPSSLPWHTVTVVSDRDEVKTYRGGRFKSKSPGKYNWPGVEGVADTTVDLERGQGRYVDDEDENDETAPLAPEEDEDTISPSHHETPHEADSSLGWCERFCNDPAPVKSFTLTRTLNGFSSESLRQSIVSHIRATNYRGHISVHPTLREGSMTIYSPHWINRFRNNPYIYWTCIIFQLWLITWPTILLLERQYNVVFSNWNAALLSEDRDVTERRKIYARNRDEAALMDYWAPAIKHAAWNRRQKGEIVTEQDVLNFTGMSDDEILGGRTRAPDSDLERDRRERINRGEGTWADSFVGVVRGVSEVGREWSRATGWGGDC
ncbi:hypothetical protein PVAR5_2336 [Paecilomyces variotii No. 5]|uniref:Uncharacterized protein n=1 Tax=Byssochlamys spectabilis (strain No. 5 / NBRC 109023) TaxID=1356009 RepID=V5FVH4_BYSSN|nr:hypothetical protein PVAR5_2336 [Paecilomyces variotii No. 5]